MNAITSPRRIRSLLTVAAVVVGGVGALTACAGPAQTDWLLTPITFGTGASTPSTDALVPLELTRDNEGGFWGGSEGVWIHVNSAGETTERISGATIENGWRVTGLAALSPTQILVSTVWVDGEHFGEILLVDTATSYQQTIVHGDRGIGDVAAAGGAVFFTEYEAGTDNFAIRRLDPISGEVLDIATVQGNGSMAAIDIDDDSTLYVATESARTVMNISGAVVRSENRTSQNPHVAVSAGGSVIWVDDSRPDSSSTYWVSDGSPEARTIIDEHTHCTHSNLTVQSDSGEATIGFLCEPSGVVWLSDDEFAVSVGDEGGAPIVKVLPAWP